MHKDQILVRACRRDDMAAVTAIYRYAVLNGTGTFEIEPPDETEMIARHARITAQTYPFLVACLDETVVGYAYAFAYRDRPAYRFTVENSVYIREDRQGRGVGAVLIQALLDECAARGFRQMIAVIGDSDNSASIRLHEKAGFERLGLLRAVGWKGGRWLDVVLMQRALGPGDGASPDALPHKSAYHSGRIT